MKIISIQTSEKKEYDKDGKIFESSFVKTKAVLPQEVNNFGLALDTQTDKRYHGGETKALMASSSENYDFFKKELGLDNLPNGTFGENLTISGLDEKSVSIGSIYKLGDLILEVTQPREPCWKVSYFLKHKDGTKVMYKSGLTGWYFRVIQGGILREDDNITLVEKKNQSLTIAALNSLVNKTLDDKKLLDEAINCLSLGEPFRKSLLKI